MEKDIAQSATKGFDDILHIIFTAKENALRKVNEELVQMYWNVGHILNEQCKSAAYGDKYIDNVAAYIKGKHPELKGFTRRGLYRMKQFYETYCNSQIVSPLVTQLPWTSHLLILSGCKTKEEKEFYIRLAIKERYSKRELERQIDSGYYERFVLSKNTLAPATTSKIKDNPFLDSYIIEFLDLPSSFSEKDFRKSLIQNMKEFVLEIGRDFSFVGEEYRVQVGLEDFYIDLLFMHRELQCLVAIELKIGKFKPEYVSKMDFYLEALDRQVKKPHENPSVGLILCANKDDEVVEYAISRTLSPMMVAEYKTKLPDKAILRRKMQELISLENAKITKEAGL